MISATELAAQLRREFGLRADPDDPILIAALSQHALLESVVADIKVAIQEAADHASAASAQHIARAREEGRLLIENAATWAADQFRVAANDGALPALEEMKRILCDADDILWRVRLYEWVFAGSVGVMFMAAVALFFVG